MKFKPEAMERNVVVHCPERWQAEALCEALHLMGKTWCDDTSYAGITNYGFYGEYSCYNIFEGTYGSLSSATPTHCPKRIKIINFYDAVIMEENTMDEEKKYEWCIEELNFDDITKNICSEKYLNEFKAWCFDRGNFNFNSNLNGRIATLKSQTGIELLAELHKCYRKHWLEYALKEGFIRDIEETYKIGDVIELTTGHNNVFNYIVNSAGINCIVLNDLNGYRWTDFIEVNNLYAITKKELDKSTNNQKVSFRKVGYGAKDLI